MLYNDRFKDVCVVFQLMLSDMVCLFVLFSCFGHPVIFCSGLAVQRLKH